MEMNGVSLGNIADQTLPLANQGKTFLIAAVDGQIVGVIAAADTIKPDAQETINQLHKLGLTVMMITGDNQRTAQAIASQAGIEPSTSLGINRVLAEVLPQDKANEIDRLQKEGYFTRKS